MTGRTSLYFSALVSMPFVPGHEIVGELLDDCEDLPKGTRVVLDSVLTCAARGVEPCEGCASGSTNRCDRITVGHVAPGLQTGFCHDTGGGWSDVMIAHRSQLYAVPDGLSDERAVLVEPLACAVHAALRAEVEPGQSVLVSRCRCGRAVRHARAAGADPGRPDHRRRQAREAARAGPGVRCQRRGRARRGRSAAYGARPARSGSSRTRAGEFLLGGVDVAVDAVGSKDSIDTVLRVTKAGGRVVLSGMPASGADLTPVWFRELEVDRHLRVRAGGAERPPGVRDRARPGRRGPRWTGSSGRRYPLYRWREALDHAQSAGRLGTVKVAFDVRAS